MEIWQHIAIGFATNVGACLFTYAIMKRPGWLKHG